MKQSDRRTLFDEFSSAVRSATTDVPLTCSTLAIRAIMLKRPGRFVSTGRSPASEIVTGVSKASVAS